MIKAVEKQYAILGLGTFGASVAETLSNFDCEVIAVDKHEKHVQRIANVVTQAMQCDITDMEELRAAGIADCDVAIVCMGRCLDDSVMGIINLKGLGVPYIIIKANKECHVQVYERLGVNRIVRPEKERGVEVAKSLLGENFIRVADLDKDYSVVEMCAPSMWVKDSLRMLYERYGMHVIGIRSHSNGHLTIRPNVEYVINEGDHLLIITDVASLEMISTLQE